MQGKCMGSEVPVTRRPLPLQCRCKGWRANQLVFLRNARGLAPPLSSGEEGRHTSVFRGEAAKSARLNQKMHTLQVTDKSGAVAPRTRTITSGQDGVSRSHTMHMHGLARLHTASGDVFGATSSALLLGCRTCRGSYTVTCRALRTGPC